MLIREKGLFARGSMLLLSFLGILIFLLISVMHEEQSAPLTDLQCVDNVFKELFRGNRPHQTKSKIKQEHQNSARP
ncbi:hypothetical protein AGMMS49925_09550 [Deltaproteobacteria bacterium]|nr:hypothetical protein AGMMS49925_09550 [Deltaproteobacteria bacterium]